MKKLLLLAAGCCLLTASAEFKTSNGSVELRKLNSRNMPQQQMKTRAGADRSLTYGYCLDYGDALGTGVPESYVSGAIYVPEEVSQQLAGNAITALRIAYGQSSNTTVSLFVTEELADGKTGIMNPLYVEDGTIEKPNGWNDVALTTPYVFDGTPVYVGYYTKQLTAQDYPIGLDGYVPITDYGSYLGIGSVDRQGNLVWNWDKYPEFGSISLQLIVSGETLPEYMAQICGMAVPNFITTANPFELAYIIRNTGTESFQEATFNVNIGGNTVSTQTVKFEKPVAPDELVQGTIMIDVETTGANLPVELDIVKLDGNDNKALLLNSYAINANIAEYGYDKKVVVEEFTGTWCGWCPRGIVGMEYMRKNYAKDGFIGIAVHQSQAGSADPMHCSTYAQVVNAFVSGFPSCLMDRTYQFDPNAQDLEAYFLDIKRYQTYADVNFEAVYNSEANTVDVNTTTEFAIDLDNVSYKLAIVLIQNEVGPYPQTNYYAGGKYGDMNGWGAMKSRENTIYNDVARIIVSPFGINNSVPTAVQKGVPYTFSQSVSASQVTDMTNCEAVVMLLDANTQQIINASISKISNVDAGVDALFNSNDGIYRVYNTQGVKVLETENADAINNLSRGIYIVNGKKVVVK